MHIPNYIRKIAQPLLTHMRERRLEQFRSLLAKTLELSNQPFIVKVGANDGKTGDPAAAILQSNSNCCGLLIEPVPYLHDALRANYPDTARFKLIKMAVGTPGVHPFFFVDPEAKGLHPELPEWFDQIGSFDRHHILKHFPIFIEAFIRSIQVETATLDSILESHSVGAIDFLHVDTEGHDLVVLKSLDLNRFQPKIIFIEHKHLSRNDKNKMFRILRSHRYQVRNTGGDFFASK